MMVAVAGGYGRGGGDGGAADYRLEGGGDGERECQSQVEG